jgi:MFS family permease
LRVIGAGAASLGLIEGISDALASFVKLGAGFHSDKIGHRKAWTVVGYALTAVAKAIFAFALAWPLILVARVIGWFGRGIRGPLRDAMLADSVEPRHRGKAFGFHRAADTLGAVVGPLLAFWLLGLVADHPGALEPFTGIFPLFATAPGPEYRLIFLLTLIPGLLSVASVLFLVKEKRRPANHGLQFWRALGTMPKDYRSFL